MNYKANKKILLDGLGWVNPGEFVEDIPEEIATFLLADNSISAMEEAIPTTQRETMTKTPWIHNPADLDGYDIDTLNALIAQDDKDCDPYETTEEAIAHLSMDYEEWQRLNK